MNDVSRDVLRDVFGHAEPGPGQREAVDGVLGGRAQGGRVRGDALPRRADWPGARSRAARVELGRARVLVATSAFGMGVDYPDVRAIVHFQAPGSLEAYYQEAGRASRDGNPGRCVMLFGAADLVTQRRLSTGAGAGATSHRHEEALATLERYANAARCRQQILCAHFTGGDDPIACRICDICVDPSSARAVDRAPVERAAVLAATAGRVGGGRFGHRKPRSGPLPRAGRP